MTNKLTHLDEQGNANMVDVSAKAITTRIAQASAIVSMQTECFELIVQGGHKKGDVLTVARIAGIQAAKKCSDLIPLCHPLMLSKVQVDFELLADSQQIKINTLCKLDGKTGVEMEALTAASVAALTIYDMCKAVDPTMVISDIKLEQKQGGKTGHWQGNDANVVADSHE